jgi:ABC-type nitrate/sulfonate/bicarbonate transport system substrate-binding protein
MPTFSRQLLSGSTSGKPIPVAATATPGTLLHTAVAGGYDEIYLYVANVTGAAVTITVEWGGTSDPADLICKSVSVPANSGPTELVKGIVLNGGLVVRAFSSTANACNITGFVSRIQ